MMSTAQNQVDCFCQLVLRLELRVTSKVNFSMMGWIDSPRKTNEIMNRMMEAVAPASIPGVQ